MFEYALVATRNLLLKEKNTQLNQDSDNYPGFYC